MSESISPFHQNVLNTVYRRCEEYLKPTKFERRVDNQTVLRLRDCFHVLRRYVICSGIDQSNTVVLETYKENTYKNRNNLTKEWAQKVLETINSIRKLLESSVINFQMVDELRKTEKEELKKIIEENRLHNEKMMEIQNPKPPFSDQLEGNCIFMGKTVLVEQSHYKKAIEAMEKFPDCGWKVEVMIPLFGF